MNVGKVTEKLEVAASVMRTDWLFVGVSAVCLKVHKWFVLIVAADHYGNKACAVTLTFVFFVIYIRFNSCFFPLVLPDIHLQRSAGTPLPAR